MKRIEKVIVFGYETINNKKSQLLTKANVEVKVISPEKRSSACINDVDCIIEDLPHDIEGKKIFLKELKSLQPHIIIATTAMWGITELAAVTEKTENFIGLNFKLNEFTGNWLVQISKGLETSQGIVKACRELIERAGATPVELQDSPGLILYRPIVAAINEGALMYMTGIASIEDMDEAIRIRRRWPKGLFEIADDLGIDQVVTMLEVMASQMGDQYLPCLLLRKMVAAGRLGKKTGRGFYTYTRD